MSPATIRRSLLVSILLPPLSLSGAAPAGVFRDVSADLHLKLDNAAACWADLNRDGWVDLCCGRVWLNERGTGFRALPEGVGQVVAADFDNDGWVDLFSWSQLRLYRNVEGRQFELLPLPTLPPCVSRGAAWGDFNGDGWVDLYVGGFEDWNAGITYPDLLLTNNQGQTFTLAWSDARYRARGVTACDFDQDGDLDVYVSNYRLQPNQLWLNNGTGGFRDGAGDDGVLATSPGFNGGHSIGAAWGDFDEDGQIDLFAGNFAHVDQRGDQPKSRFYRNLGPGRLPQFADRGPCGIQYQESYASPAAGDYDNDGDLDLYFTTVYGVASFGRPNHPVLFRNDGGFQFTDVTEAAGLAAQPPTYQAAWADYDQDGDLDLVTAGKLFQNETNPRSWLAVRLAGDGQSISRSAIGAQVRLRIGTRVLTRQVEAGTGEGNQNDLTLHFGLGDHATPVVLEVLWPNRQQQRVPAVEVNRTVDCAVKTR